MDAVVDGNRAVRGRNNAVTGNNVFMGEPLATGKPEVGAGNNTLK